MLFLNTVTKDKTRIRPTGLIDKKWPDGSKYYVFLNRCSQCRDEMLSYPAIYSLDRDVTTLVGWNLCQTCLTTLHANIKSSAVSTRCATPRLLPKLL